MRSLTALLYLLIALPPALAEGASARIDRMLSSGCMAGARVSVSARSVSDGRIIYSKNPGDLLIPASNMKIITTAAALKILKPWFTFDTVFSHTGILKDGTINGDLVVSGRGNPHLVSEDFWIMANELRKRGVRRISGNLALDESYFDNERLPPGWQRGRYRRAFTAPTGALSLNFNSVNISIYPSLMKKGKPVVAVDPKTPYFTLINNLSALPSGKTSITIDMKRRRDGGETIVVAGTVRTGSAEKTYHRSVADPALYFGLTFMEFLNSAGIDINGKAVSYMPTEQTEEIFTHSSRPLSFQLSDMNKFSNNFMAEQIIKTIGAEAVSLPGTFEKGLSKVEDFLISWGFPPDRFKLTDGSGLSRNSRLSSSLIVDVLRRFYGEWGGGAEFVASLAVMGREGSVRSRIVKMNKPVRVKTGTLSGVSALSGYFSLDSEEIAAFSIILNGFSCGNGDILGLQNDILLELKKADGR